MKRLLCSFTVLVFSLTVLSSCGFSSKRKAVDPDDIISAESYGFEKLSFDGLEKTEFHTVLEAEDCAPGTGVSVKTAKSGYSGEGYVDISDNSGFKMTVDIPSNQFYKITFRHCADGHKENDVLFNGQKAFTVYSEAGDWQETVTDGIFLEKGKNTVTLGSGWSW